MITIKKSLFTALYTGRIGRREYWFGIFLLCATLLPFTDISPLYTWTGQHIVFGFFLLPFIIAWVLSLHIRRINDLTGELWTDPPTIFNQDRNWTGSAVTWHALLAPTNQKKNKFGPPLNRKKNLLQRTLGL